MFCPQCGAKSMEEASFCHRGGVRLGTSQAKNLNAGAINKAATTSGLVSLTGHRARSLSDPKVLAAGTGPPIMTFQQFHSKKENTRRSQFQPKSVNKQKLKEVKKKSA